MIYMGRINLLPMGRDQTKGPSNADRGRSLPSLVTPRGGGASDSVEEKEGIGFECRGKGIVPEAFWVIVSDRGPEWVPPDPRGVTCLVEFMDKRLEITSDIKCTTNFGCTGASPPP